MKFKKPTTPRTNSNKMAFKKSNQHRRLITECLNFNAFKVFLNLPKEDNTKQLINAFVGYNCPAEQEALVRWYIRRFGYIKTLNTYDKVELRKRIKKLKNKGKKINYSIEGKCNTFCMRLNLLNHYYDNWTARHELGQFSTKYDNIELFVAHYKCDQYAYNKKCNRVIKAIKKNPMHFFKLWRSYCFNRSGNSDGFKQLKQP